MTSRPDPLLRLLVVFDALLYFASWRIGWWEQARLQGEPALWLRAWQHGWWEERWVEAQLAFASSLVLHLLAWTSLLLVPRIGRWVYLLGVLWTLAWGLLLPLAMCTRVEGLFAALSFLLAGMILARCFLAEAPLLIPPDPSETP